MEKYNHHYHLSHFIHNKYNDLLLSNTFRHFALSLISLFLPIYLLKLGYSMFVVILYEILFHVVLVFVYFGIVKFVNSGVKRSMIFSYLLNIVLYWILYKTPYFMTLFSRAGFLILIGVINVFALAFFWMAFHIYFLDSTKDSNSGLKYGLLQAIPILLSIISPFVGSLLITTFSFEITFGVTICLLSFGGLFLFFSDDVKSVMRFNLRSIFVNKYNSIFFIEGINAAATSIIWPLFLYLLGFKLVTMGFLYFISNALYALMSFLSGKFSDKHGPKKIMSYGSVGQGITLIARVLSKTMFFITITQGLGGVFGAMLFVPYHTKFYNISRQDRGNIILARETFLHVGKVLLYIVLLMLILFFDPIVVFAALIVFSGIATFSFSYLVRIFD